MASSSRAFVSTSDGSGPSSISANGSGSTRSQVRTVTPPFFSTLGDRLLIPRTLKVRGRPSGASTTIRYRRAGSTLPRKEKYRVPPGNAVFSTVMTSVSTTAPLSTPGSGACRSFRSSKTSLSSETGLSPMEAGSRTIAVPSLRITRARRRGGSSRQGFQ